MFHLQFVELPQTIPLFLSGPNDCSSGGSTPQPYAGIPNKPAPPANALPARANTCSSVVRFGEKTKSTAAFDCAFPRGKSQRAGVQKTRAIPTRTGQAL